MKGKAREIGAAFGVSMAQSKKQPQCSASSAAFHRAQAQRNVLKIIFLSKPCVGCT